MPSLPRAAAAYLSGLLLASSLCVPRVPTRAETPQPSGVAAASSAAPTATAAINLTVCIVEDLAPKPVPLTDFVCVAADGTKTTLRTDMTGKAHAALAPGHYRVQSAAPLDYKGHTYNWSKEVDIAAADASGTDVTLTQSDATVQPLADAGTPPPGEMSTGAIYKVVGAAVVGVQGDFGRGSGFLVDAKEGLILTCAHVVQNTHQAEVRLDVGKRYAAQVVAVDKESDVAVVKVNPAVLPAGLREIALRDLSADPIAEGDTVIAIGWPLDQNRLITQGIVSRVESDALISDVNINHGNSGGPLLDTDGRAVGITTFLDSAENGPGISGIVSIMKAAAVLAQARRQVADGDVAEPPIYLLPDISQVPLEPAALEQAQLQELHPWSIDRPKNFATMLYTPFVLASLETADERAMEKGKSHRVSKRGDSEGIKDESENPVRRYWDKYVGEDQAYVAVVIAPALKEKSGSIWHSLVNSAVNKFARTSLTSKHVYEYRDDFYDMQLWRGDHLVLPVASYRTNATAYFRSQLIDVTDEAYAGLYAYDPGAFEPSEPLVIKMRRESNLNNWDVIPIEARDQLAIWDQFSGYRIANPAAGVPTLAPEQAELAAVQQFQAGTVAKASGNAREPQTSLTMAAKKTSYPAPAQSAAVVRFVLKDGTVKNGIVQRQEDGLIFIANNLGTDLVKEASVVSQTTLPDDQARQYLPK